MRKARYAVVLVITSILLSACGSDSTKGDVVATQPVAQKPGNDGAKDAAVVNANKADIGSGDKLLDAFIETQLCIIEKSDASKKVNVGKMKETVELKRSDKEKSDNAREKLSASCNQNEADSIHGFFVCMKKRCDAVTKSDEIKPGDCPEPSVSNGCQSAFEQFMAFFFMPEKP